MRCRGIVGRAERRESSRLVEGCSETRRNSPRSSPLKACLVGGAGASPVSEGQDMLVSAECLPVWQEIEW